MSQEDPATTTIATPFPLAVGSPSPQTVALPSLLTVGSLKVFKTFPSNASSSSTFLRIVAIAGNLKDPPFVAKASIARHPQSPETTATFAREYEVLRQSVHPNIVKLHTPTSDCPELGVVQRRNSRNPICLELMDLGSLHEVLTNVRPRVQNPDQLCELAKAIAVQSLLGLQYLHSHGSKHRNVSPRNILVSADGRVKWCGLSSKDSGEVGMGVNGYIAPEVLMSSSTATTEKVDLWGLGCVLYWIVTNAVPVATLTINDLAESLAQAGSQLHDLFDLDKAIHDAELRDLLAHLLVSDPAKRDNSFQALRHPALRKYYRGCGVIPRDDKYSKVVAPFVRHNLVIDAVDCTEESELELLLKVSRQEIKEVPPADRDAMRTAFKVLTYSRQKPSVDCISKFLKDHGPPRLIDPVALAAWNVENAEIAQQRAPQTVVIAASATSGARLRESDTTGTTTLCTTATHLLPAHVEPSDVSMAR